MITGQKPIKTSKQGQFQIIDVVDMMQPLTKYTRQIVSGGNIPSRVREAFRLAEEERPGAAHLELPEDIAARGDRLRAVFPRASPAARSPRRRRSAPRSTATAQTRKHPLLLIGAGANRKLDLQDAAPLRRADRASPSSPPRWARAWSTRRSPLLPRQRRPLRRRLRPSRDRRCRPDHQRRPRRRREAAVLHEPATASKSSTSISSRRGRSGLLSPGRGRRRHRQRIWQISEAITSRRRTGTSRASWRFAARSRHTCEKAPTTRAFPSSRSDWSPTSARSMPDDGIIALDNGIYKIWFARNYKARLPQHRAARQRAGHDGRRPAVGDGGASWSIPTARSWRSAATAAS